MRSDISRVGETRRVTVLGLVANLLLSVLKVVGGVMSNSQALVADAVHSLSDSVTDLAVLIGASYWNAPADQDHPHGHGRIETLITAMIGIVLAAVGIALGYHALNTIHSNNELVPGWIAFWIALISIGVKEFLYRWNRAVGIRICSPALIANAWHHRSDGLSSVPVAVAVLGEHLYPSWNFLDQVAAVLVSVLILHASYKIVRPAIAQLCDIGIGPKESQKILDTACEIEGVRAVHALRTRFLGSGWQADLHVQVDANLTVRQGHDISGIVKQKLLGLDINITDVLVHIEPF
jgi:cation diffusion facilitator family transporter